MPAQDSTAERRALLHRTAENHRFRVRISHRANNYKTMSRPKLKDGAKRENVTLTLPPKLIRDAKEMADEAGTSLSKMVEMLLVMTFMELDKRITKKKSKKKPLIHKG